MTDKDLLGQKGSESQERDEKDERDLADQIANDLREVIRHLRFAASLLATPDDDRNTSHT